MLSSQFNRVEQPNETLTAKAEQTDSGIRSASVSIESIRTEGTPVPSEEAVELMMASFEAVGQCQDIEVDGRYQLIFGRVRVEAGRRLGWVEISAKVRSDIPNDQAARDFIRLEENTVRGSRLRPSELVMVAKTHVLPLLEAAGARNLAAAQARGRETRWGGAEVEGADYAPSMDTARLEPAVRVEGADYAPSIASVIAGPGKTRKKLGEIFGMSGDRVEKLVKMSNVVDNDEFPAEVREFARAEFEACDTDHNVDGHFNAVKKALDNAVVEDQERAERERSKLITRLQRAAAEMANAARTLTVEQVQDILANDDAGQTDWDTVLSHTTEATTTLHTLTARAQERLALV